ncbi:MAG TPA: hypothetical protein VGO52_16725 [Hyphomonadaceae bacterium]|jgi:hypothetical protein|nr:hypothetical protein [Hyphomonadaceae bacterium]
MTLPVKHLVAAFAAALLTASPAFAQAVKGLDGRWQGDVARPDGGKLTVVFKVATKDGKTSTTFESPDQGARGYPASVERTGDKVLFKAPDIGVSFDATLSADGKTLAGKLGQGVSSFPLTMTQKAESSAALTGPAIAGVDGRWEGALDAGGASMNVVLRVSTAGGKTTTLMDSPDEKIVGIPALAGRTGNEIKVDLPGIRATFTGTLSADGKTIDGFWDQSGNTLGLKLAKK